MDLLAAARQLAPRGIHLFLLHQGHFLDPRVPDEWSVLSTLPAASEDEVLRVAAELLPAAGERLRAGIYFPIPIARALARGVGLKSALADYHYELPRVDHRQRWWWKGSQVAPRLRRFFGEHLAYQPALDLYYFEYRVNPEWWDKCYLDAELTPMLADRLEERGGGLEARLASGDWIEVDPESLHLDRDEHLLCRSPSHGEVLFSDWLRFSLLKGVNEEATAIRFGALSLPLNWSDPSEPDL